MFRKANMGSVVQDVFHAQSLRTCRQITLAGFRESLLLGEAIAFVFEGKKNGHRRVDILPKPPKGQRG